MADQPRMAALRAAILLEDVFCQAFDSRAQRLKRITEIVLDSITAASHLESVGRPAVSSAVQDEAAAQGPDQIAQKEEAPPRVDSAGVAEVIVGSATDTIADQGNSSRSSEPQGEEERTPTVIPIAEPEPFDYATLVGRPGIGLIADEKSGEIIGAHGPSEVGPPRRDALPGTFEERQAYRAAVDEMIGTKKMPEAVSQRADETSRETLDPTATLDRVLTLWATTDLDPYAISRRSGCTRSSITDLLSKGYGVSDPRAVPRRTPDSKTCKVLDMWHTTMMTPTQIGAKFGVSRDEVAAMVSCSRAVLDERVRRPNRPKARAYEPGTVEAPFPEPEQAPPAESREEDMGRVLEFRGDSIVIGSRGVWTCKTLVAGALNLLNDGQFHSVEDIVAAGGWPDRHGFIGRVDFITEKLQDIGVSMTRSGDSYRIRKSGR